MKILNAKEFIGEKLNIQPISKERLDSHKITNWQKVINWIYEHNEDLSEGEEEAFDKASGEYDENDLTARMFAYGLHVLENTKYSISLMFIKLEDIEIEDGSLIDNYLKKIKSDGRLEQIGLSTYRSESGRFLTMNNTYLNNMVSYFKRNKRVHLYDFDFEVVFADDEGGSVYVSAAYNPFASKDFEKFAYNFYKKVLATANDYMVQVFNDLAK